MSASRYAAEGAVNGSRLLSAVVKAIWPRVAGNSVMHVTPPSAGFADGYFVSSRTREPQARMCQSVACL